MNYEATCLVGLANHWLWIGLSIGFGMGMLSSALIRWMTESRD